MKKILLFTLYITAFAATSCSNDEPEAPTPDASGTYTGNTVATSAYFDDMKAEGQTLTLLRDADGSYSMAYTSDTWGSFVVEAAKATVSGTTVNLSGTGTTTMGMNGNVKDYDCSLTGHADTADGGNAEFTFTVPAVMGGLTIAFSTDNAE